MIELIKQFPMENSHKNSEITATDEQIMNLILKNKTMSEMSTELNITDQKKIFYSILNLINHGYAITKAHLHKMFDISDERFVQISAALPQDKLNLDTILYKEVALKVDVSYRQLKLIIAYHRVRYHLNGLMLNFLDPDIISPQQATDSEPNSKETPATDEGVFKSAKLVQQNTTNLDNIWGDEEEDAIFLENVEHLIVDIESQKKQDIDGIDKDVFELMEIVQEIHDDKKKTENKCNLKQFEMKHQIGRSISTIHVPDTSSSSSTVVRPPIKQKIIASKRVKYINSSSDEDENDELQQKPKPSKVTRKLPSWMIDEGGCVSFSKNPVPIKGRSNFF